MHSILKVRVLLAALLVLAMFAAATGPRAFASSPHFISTAASITSAGNLVVSFKEAGLDDDVSISYTASAKATADYGCVNHGGNHPQATNKVTVQGPVSDSGTFSSGMNGTISQSLTLTPPPVPTSFSCPGGMTLVLADVTYTNVSITDTTTPVVGSIPGTFTHVFVTFK